jgi:signal transduction histidine kinase
MGKSLNPKVDIPDGRVYVHADSLATQRIIQNLITNALRYGYSGGIIGIRLYEDQDRVWLEIYDNGEGIPKKPYTLHL